MCNSYGCVNPGLWPVVLSDGFVSSFRECDVCHEARMKIYREVNGGLCDVRIPCLSCVSGSCRGAQVCDSVNLIKLGGE